MASNVRFNWNKFFIQLTSVQINTYKILTNIEGTRYTKTKNLASLRYYGKRFMHNIAAVYDCPYKMKTDIKSNISPLYRG